MSWNVRARQPLGRQARVPRSRKMPGLDLGFRTIFYTWTDFGGQTAISEQVCPRMQGLEPPLRGFSVLAPGTALPAPHIVSVPPGSGSGPECRCSGRGATRSHGGRKPTRWSSRGLTWTCLIPQSCRLLGRTPDPPLRPGTCADLPRTALVRVLLSPRDLTATGSSACLRHVHVLSLLQSTGSQSGAPRHPWGQNTFWKIPTCPLLLDSHK